MKNEIKHSKIINIMLTKLLFQLVIIGFVFYTSIRCEHRFVAAAGFGFAKSSFRWCFIWWRMQIFRYCSLHMQDIILVGFILAKNARSICSNSPSEPPDSRIQHHQHLREIYVRCICARIQLLCDSMKSSSSIDSYVGHRLENGPFTTIRILSPLTEQINSKVYSMNCTDEETVVVASDIEKINISISSNKFTNSVILFYFFN